MAKGEQRQMTFLSRRTALITALGLAGASGTARAQPAPHPATGAANSPIGRVTIRLTQAALIGSVSWGSGTLTFRGRQRRFRIRGLGAGGLGLATLTASGEVHNLTRIEDFAGTYVQGRAGAVLGEAQLQGGMWLTNSQGVRMSLRPQRRGVALQLGGDGLVIEFQR